MGTTVSLSHARIRRPAGGDQSRSACWSHQARELSQLSSQFRDASARGRLRYPDSAGTARSCGRVDNDDLPARDEPRRPECTKSLRSVVIPARSWLTAKPAANRVEPRCCLKSPRSCITGPGLPNVPGGYLALGCDRCGQLRGCSQPGRGQLPRRRAPMRRSRHFGAKLAGLAGMPLAARNAVRSTSILVSRTKLDTNRWIRSRRQHISR